MSDTREGFSHLANVLVAPIANIVARIYVGLEFFQSGMTKIENWDKTTQLFQEEWIIPFLTPNISALLFTAGELVFPVMLMVGLCTRFAAMGLLCIVAAIEFIVFKGSGENLQYYYCMIIFALMMGYGGDKISLDNLLFRRKKRYRF